MNEAGGLLECHELAVRVPGRELLRDLEASIRPGTMLAVLGRNGVGKSSLLHVMAGLAAPACGEVRLDGIGLTSWPRRALARRLGLLPQAVEDPFPGSALQTALVGRHPHLDFWQWEGETDRAVALDCLAAMDLAGLVHGCHPISRAVSGPTRIASSDSGITALAAPVAIRPAMISPRRCG